MYIKTKISRNRGRQRERKGAGEGEGERPPAEVNVRISDIATASFSADAERALTPRTFTTPPKKKTKKNVYKNSLLVWSAQPSLLSRYGYSCSRDTTAIEGQEYPVKLPFLCF